MHETTDCTELCSIYYAFSSINGQVVYIVWIYAEQRLWFTSWPGQSRRTPTFTKLLRMACGLKLMNYLFLVIFSGHGSPWVTETSESKTIVKGGLLEPKETKGIYRCAPNSLYQTSKILNSLNFVHQMENHTFYTFLNTYADSWGVQNHPKPRYFQTELGKDRGRATMEKSVC